VGQFLLTVAHVGQFLLTVAHVGQFLLTVAHVGQFLLTVAHVGQFLLTVGLQVMVERLTLLFCIWKVRGSNTVPRPAILPPVHPGKYRDRILD
jgi:hypothetical protein